MRPGGVRFGVGYAVHELVAQRRRLPGEALRALESGEWCRGEGDPERSGGARV
jgi:hypothetical protein